MGPHGWPCTVHWVTLVPLRETICGSSAALSVTASVLVKLRVPPEVCAPICRGLKANHVCQKDGSVRGAVVVGCCIAPAGFSRVVAAASTML